MSEKLFEIECLLSVFAKCSIRAKSQKEALAIANRGGAAIGVIEFEPHTAELKAVQSVKEIEE